MKALEIINHASDVAFIFFYTCIKNTLETILKASEMQANYACGREQKYLTADVYI